MIPVKYGINHTADMEIFEWTVQQASYSYGFNNFML